jgi:hypothetical protein
MKEREMLRFGLVVVAIGVEAVGLLKVVELGVKTVEVEHGILEWNFALGRDVSNLRNLVQ